MVYIVNERAENNDGASNGTKDGANIGLDDGESEGVADSDGLNAVFDDVSDEGDEVNGSVEEPPGVLEEGEEEEVFLEKEEGLLEEDVERLEDWKRGYAMDPLSKKSV